MSLAPQRLRGFQFSVKPSFSSSMPASLEDVEITPDPIPIPQPFQPSPEESSLIEQFFGDVPPPEQAPLMTFPLDETTPSSYQPPLIARGEPIVIKQEPFVIYGDYNQQEWLDLDQYIKRKDVLTEFPAKILFAVGKKDYIFDFIKYIISTRMERNSSTSECFVHYLNMMFEEAKNKDGVYTQKEILKVLKFFNHFYENRPFNVMMRRVIESIGEYEPVLNDMTHHSIFVSQEQQSNAIVYDYHHYGAAFSRIQFASEIVKGYFISIMKVVIAMSEVFNQLHLFHLKVQNSLSSHLYFGEDFYTPADSLVEAYHFMGVIAEFKGQINENNFNVLIKWLMKPEKGGVSNNDMKFVIPIDKSKDQSIVEMNSQIFRGSSQNILSNLKSFMLK